MFTNSFHILIFFIFALVSQKAKVIVLMGQFIKHRSFISVLMCYLAISLTVLGLLENLIRSFMNFR